MDEPSIRVVNDSSALLMCQSYSSCVALITGLCEFELSITFSAGGMNIAFPIALKLFMTILKAP
jgi:hypothetical protein